jgi:peptidoglycan/xylan/chitin deacetylase (PgdA/CDA1 family)
MRVNSGHLRRSACTVRKASAVKAREMQHVKRIARSMVRRIMDRSLRSRTSGTLLVLMFHRVLPADHPESGTAEPAFMLTDTDFDQVCGFLARSFGICTLNDVLAGRHRSHADGPEILLTFDDGWRDTLSVALPIARRHGIRPAVFVATSVLDDTRDVWWQDALVQLGRQERLDSLQRIQALQQVLHTTQDQPTHVRLWQLARSIASMPADQFSVVTDGAIELAYPSPIARQMLSRDDLVALARDADIGIHGHTHVPLDLADDPDAEIGEALSALGMGPRALSLPHGRAAPGFHSSARKDPRLVAVFDSRPVINRLSPASAGQAWFGRVNLASWMFSDPAGRRFDPDKLFLSLLDRGIETPYALQGQDA